MGSAPKDFFKDMVREFYESKGHMNSEQEVKFLTLMFQRLYIQGGLDAIGEDS